MPENASKEELLKWKKRKNTAKWHYEKLTSEDAEVYRISEMERVKKAKDQQRQSIIEAAQGVSAVYKHVDDSPHTKAKEKSRAR